MMRPCRCGHCDQEIDENSRTGWAEPCYRRWLRAGKPDTGPPPPDPTRKHSRARPAEPLETVSCACGHCGEPAVRPAAKPLLAERCYRRSLRLGLGGAVPPPPAPPNAPKPERKPRIRKPPPPPPTAEAFGITDFRAAEVLRKIPGEVARAEAYAAAVARRDWLGADAVFTRVQDLDAFDALLDAGLDIPKARAALAELLTRKFPDLPQDETEAAA